MIRYKRNDYELEFLEPEVDRLLLGDRFCWGASLWQLRDRQGREYLSGPEFPFSEPDPFNNQGMPEVFRKRDKNSNRFLNIHRDGRGLVIGVGLVHMAKGTPLIIDRPCLWKFEEEGNDLVWRTSDHHGDWSYELERRWSVDGNKLTSLTRIKSIGRAALDVHWYPHPFFPLVKGGTSFSVEPSVEAEGTTGGFVKESDSYRITAACYTQKGCFEWLKADYTDLLRWSLTHPLCGQVRVAGRFSTAYMPVWCNENTISLEPHVLFALKQDEKAEWEITYTFGDYS